MKSILLSLLLFLMPSIYENSLHEFHVSKCSVDYDAEDKALQITVHLFIDDLEEALRQQGVDELFIATEKEANGVDEYIDKYLHQRFEVLVEDQPVDFEYLGKETSEDLQAIWCYMEITDVETIESLTITNQILMEVHDDQKNIMNITGPEKKKAYFLFLKGNSTKTIDFYE